jgi:hypothetical protein
MFLDGRGKIVRPIILRNEIKVGNRSRVDGGQKGVFAGITDRGGGKPSNDIGVIRSGSHQILFG